MIRLVLVLSLLSSSLVFAKTISDDLVENLDCKKLDSATIYSHIRKESFSTDRHLPLENWGFRYGFYRIANCWSLTHLQRIYFYLGREPRAPLSLDLVSSVSKSQIANLIRGFEPYFVMEEGLKNWPLKNWFVFPAEKLMELSAPWSEELEHGHILERSLASEVEHYQAWRFHQLKNSKLVFEKVPREESEHRNLAIQLKKLIDQKRLPLVVIKANLKTQHVVMVKSYEEVGGRTHFIVYDSNFPDIQNEFSFDEDSQFRAPSIIGRLGGIQNPNQLVSVYLVDDKDHIKIGNALVRYYKKKCE